MTATEGQPPTSPLSAARALTELMRRTEVIRKERESGAGERYLFRGVDDVMNAVGPAMRELGLLCIPKLLWQETNQVEYGGKRTLAFRTRVQVMYTLIGPDSTEITVGPVLGESIDTGDKGGAKAQSVAYREMWLRTLCVPTGEKDPDEDQYKIAKPEAAASDPVVVAKLADQIKKADSRAKLQAAYKSVQAAYEGDQASITKQDADRATEAIKAKLAELEAPQTRPAQDQSEAAPQQGGQPS